MKKVMVSLIMMLGAVSFVAAEDGAFSALQANAPMAEKIVLPAPNAKIVMFRRTQADNKMEKLLMRLNVVSMQLQRDPQGAPAAYVRDVEGVRKSMYLSYAKLMNVVDNYEDLNPEAAANTISKELTSFRAQMKRLEMIIGKISTSPNYVQLRGPELAQILQGMKRNYDEWEYDLSQAGT